MTRPNIGAQQRADITKIHENMFNAPPKEEDIIFMAGRIKGYSDKDFAWLKEPFCDHLKAALDRLRKTL